MVEFLVRSSAISPQHLDLPPQWTVLFFVLLSLGKQDPTSWGKLSFKDDTIIKSHRGQMLYILSELDQVQPTAVQTFTFLLFFLHLLQSLEHASQVGNTVLESEFLVFWRRSMAENIPHVHIGLCAHLTHVSNTHKPTRGGC